MILEDYCRGIDWDFVGNFKDSTGTDRDLIDIVCSTASSPEDILNARDAWLALEIRLAHKQFQLNDTLSLIETASRKQT